jgi:hypothetical protein
MSITAYELVEYDPLRPWIVLSHQQRTVDLPEGVDFDQWALRRFPDDRFRVLRERSDERWSALNRPD